MIVIMMMMMMMILKDHVDTKADDVIDDVVFLFLLYFLDFG